MSNKSVPVEEFWQEKKIFLKKDLANQNSYLINSEKPKKFSTLLTRVMIYSCYVKYFVIPPTVSSRSFSSLRSRCCLKRSRPAKEEGRDLINSLKLDVRGWKIDKEVRDWRFVNWIPPFGGMTREKIGMTGEKAGMTREKIGMTGERAGMTSEILSETKSGFNPGFYLGFHLGFSLCFCLLPEPQLYLTKSLFG